MSGGGLTNSKLEKLFCAGKGEEEGMKKRIFRIFHEDETLRRGENGDFFFLNFSGTLIKKFYYRK